jgi:hypothetical protein
MIEMAENEVISDRETAVEMLRAAAAMEYAQRSFHRVQTAFPNVQPQLPNVAPPVPRRQAVAKKIHSQSASPLPRAIRHRKRNCRCGSCQKCLENARWERVFNEKFADLEYYTGLRISQRSPLAEL